MNIRFRIRELKLRHTFTISRESRDVVPVVIVEVDHDGTVGLGEVSPSAYHGQTPESVLAHLEAARSWLEGLNPQNFRSILIEADERLGGDRQALCALDLALHDWAARRLGISVRRLLGTADGPLPPTSYTIGIDTTERMIEKLGECPGLPVYKVKLGTDRDLEIVEALRARTDAAIRVDANCGWTPDGTIAISRELKRLGVEFIEQPLPAERLEEMERVLQESHVPVVADENSVGPADVPGLRGRFDGINIKLTKCGGLAPALAMVSMARSMGMKVMFGCMIESSLGCTAAAQIGATADWLDLDGPLLIESDPYQGMLIRDGRIQLPTEPGLGVRPTG